MALPFQQKVTIILLMFYWPTLFILAHIPIPQLVRQAHVSDKSLHFIAYLILAFLLWFSLNPDRKASWRRATVWWVSLVIAGYGVVDELLQDYVAGRSCDAIDCVANLAGTFTGLILFSLLSFWPVLLVLAGITIFTLTNIARANPADLLPITNAIFHLLAYGFFTAIWMQYTHLFLRTKPPQAKWLIVTSLPPIVFLFMVKLFSRILGRAAELPDVIFSVAGIVAVVATGYLFSILRRPKDSKHSTTE